MGSSALPTDGIWKKVVHDPHRSEAGIVGSARDLGQAWTNGDAGPRKARNL
jgi:hypothetical protein